MGIFLEEIYVWAGKAGLSFMYPDLCYIQVYISSKTSRSQGVRSCDLENNGEQEIHCTLKKILSKVKVLWCLRLKFFIIYPVAT